MKVLFLSLKGFSGVGGIEKVSRVISRVLADMKTDGVLSHLCCLSAYDSEADARYVSPEDFRGFGGNRGSFCAAAIRAGWDTDLVLLSHVNLAPVGLAIKLLHPAVRMVLIAHGIEIWPRLNGLKREFLCQCSSILAISQFTKDKLVANNEVAPARVEIVHNAIDRFFRIPSYFAKPPYLLQRYGLHPDDHILLTVTRISSLERYKGYDRVLEAVAGVKPVVPKIKYLLAGKADPTEKQRLAGLVASLGIQAEVIMTGYVTEEELTDHFLLGDVFVMPSKKEGFGIVFIEALACGLTVIAGNKDGSVDAVRNGELGILVDPDSTEEIRQAIITGLARARQLDEHAKQQQSRRVLEAFGFEPYRQHLQKTLLAHLNKKNKIHN
ncbi:MAG: glycosyltransferase family 4 protein [Ferruginibacter sp.]|nr:glycosyltransferase family 4 protein [Cytophagales bacterium]